MDICMYVCMYVCMTPYSTHYWVEGEEGGGGDGHMYVCMYDTTQHSYSLLGGGEGAGLDIIVPVCMYMYVSPLVLFLRLCPRS